MKLKITSIGNSAGVILPKELLARLRVDKGDELHAVETPGGVVLSVGSAIMAPQVFEKSLSCVHNLRVQEGRPLVSGHSIFVVDLQDGGGWDWSQGEPPKTSAAYYLRFCKSFSRMGGAMRYVQADNAAFVHGLLHKLRALDSKPTLS